LLTLPESPARAEGIMLRKLILGGAVGAAALAMAMPAGAATDTRTASFGRSRVTVTLQNDGSFTGSADVKGLSVPGHYIVFVEQFEYNAQHRIVSGATATLCEFDIAKHQHEGTCSGTLTNNLLGGGWTDKTMTEVDRVVNGIGKRVRGPAVFKAAS
jgi:hypothetical protein